MVQDFFHQLHRHWYLHAWSDNLQQQLTKLCLAERWRPTPLGERWEVGQLLRYIHPKGFSCAKFLVQCHGEVRNISKKKWANERILYGYVGGKPSWWVMQLSIVNNLPCWKTPLDITPSSFWQSICYWSNLGRWNEAQLYKQLGTGMWKKKPSCLPTSFNFKSNKQSTVLSKKKVVKCHTFPIKLSRQPRELQPLQFEKSGHVFLHNQKLLQIWWCIR